MVVEEEEKKEGEADKEAKVEEVEDEDEEKKKKTKKVSEGDHRRESRAQQDQASLDSHPARYQDRGMLTLLQEHDKRLGGSPGRQALLCRGSARIQGDSLHSKTVSLRRYLHFIYLISATCSAPFDQEEAEQHQVVCSPRLHHG